MQVDGAVTLGVSINAALVLVLLVSVALPPALPRFRRCSLWTWAGFTCAAALQIGCLAILNIVPSVGGGDDAATCLAAPVFDLGIGGPSVSLGSPPCRQASTNLTVLGAVLACAAYGLWAVTAAFGRRRQAEKLEAGRRYAWAWWAEAALLLLEIALITWAVWE
jgi:hypothetical protein